MAEQEQDNEAPQLGPFALEVPPPSTNGSHVHRESPFASMRRALPALVVGVILSLTTVPVRALVRTAEFALWWRLAIAAAAGGLAAGLPQRRSIAGATVGGAVVATAGLLLSYAAVPTRLRIAGDAVDVLADVGRLLLWGAGVGALGGLAGWAVATLAARRLPQSRFGRWLTRSR